MVDERPKCVLESGPSWLKMDSTGTIRGTLDSLGTAHVVIRATDSHGNTTLQSYKLYVSEPAGVETNPVGTTQLSVSPNPFGETSRFTVTIPEDSRVSMDVFDL